MGSMSALDIAAAVKDGSVPLLVALEWHLRSNHFPPHPRVMVVVAERAIELANDGEWDVDIDLPPGIRYRDGRSSISVGVALESLHLHAFLDDDGEANSQPV